MRLKKKYIFISLLFLLCGCRLTHKLEKTNYRPIVNQPTKHQKSSEVSPVQIGSNNSLAKDSINKEQVRTKDEKTGEDIVTVDLEEITVVARTKTVPERFGKVSLDFVITVPNKLLDKRWKITLTPQLIKGDEKKSLEDIVINGELYNIYQRRGRLMYEALSRRYMYFNRSSNNITKYFLNKYNLKFNDDARLDTIIPSDNSFKYYYNQDVSTDESKHINLFLLGNVEGLDKSTYDLPASDTLTYFISSMIQFIDPTQRFVQKIIERHAEANFSAHITFPVGRENIDENLDDNATEIAKVQDIIKQLTWSSEFIIDSINMTASSSPEGAWKMNEELAKRRASSLKRYFAKKLDDKEGVDTLFNAKWIAEDWKRVYNLIASEKMKYTISSQKEILAIIDGENNPDRREEQIKKRYPQEYKIIKDSIYPKLRTVEFQFNLHRSGMTQDTIHTTEPDTLYDYGRKLLESRKYKPALDILVNYNDYNTAIAYMSLGYDNPAYEILSKQSQTANSEYLLAILCSRLGKEEEAVQRFLHSVEMDESKAWRGALDPEINRLIKTYDLTKKINL